MDAAIKDQWTTALRSGKYEQGHGYLRRKAENTFCCLGVLCEIAVKNGVIPEADLGYPDAFAYRYGKQQKAAVLPRDVQDWAGLDECLPDVKYGGRDTTLADLNDAGGLSFDEIADVIDAQL